MGCHFLIRPHQYHPNLLLLPFRIVNQLRICTRAHPTRRNSGRPHSFPPHPKIRTGNSFDIQLIWTSLRKKHLQHKFHLIRMAESNVNSQFRTVKKNQLTVRSLQPSLQNRTARKRNQKEKTQTHRESNSQQRNSHPCQNFCRKN